VPLELGVTEITVAGRTAFVGVLRDITERKQTEATLIRARAELKAANEQLLKQARADGLTGIANRRYFDEVLDQEIRRATRTGMPLSLILCDIDYFKAYNDARGHLAGDQCLRQVAETLRETFHRAGDLVARYGGEEFAVIMPATDSQAAVHMAKKLRRNLQALALPHGASAVDSCVTLSAGVTTVTPDGRNSPQALIAAADEALYRAKANGRHRVEAYAARGLHISTR
jgi:diguanylate cyclase (GGDEF)-like protein